MTLRIFAKSYQSIPQICRLIERGEVLAVPTETAYGLVADATSVRAMKHILELKGRRGSKTIPLVIASLRQAQKWARFSDKEKKLAQKYWPGPLTIVLKAKRKLPRGVLSPRGAIGLRVPGDSWLRKLLFVYGKPLTATSANITGGATPYTVSAVKKSLVKRGLKYLVNGGRLKRRPTSTIAQIVNGQVKILRPGAVSEKRLRRVVS